MIDKQTAEFGAKILQALPEMSSDEMQEWIKNPKALKKVLKLALCPPEEKVEKEKSNLLEFLRTITIPATTSKFLAKEKFVINTKSSALVKIGFLGDNLKEWFLKGAGKVEDPISDQTLHFTNLKKYSYDRDIIAELGGEAKAETTLSEMFSLMEKQGKGEDGVLLANGYSNIFFIRDFAGVLRVVYVCWGRGVWNVHAYAPDDDGWSDGHRVFSRN